MGSNLLQDLLDVFKQTRSKPIQGFWVEDWRIAYFDTEMISLGIKNNTGGSVYTPPAYKRSESAEILLVWQDGKCSRARVQKQGENSTGDWDRELKLWRMAAFEDPFAVKIPVPSKIPEVDISNRDIESILRGNEAYVFEQEKRILSDRPQEAQTRANISSFWGKNAVLTSTGIDIHYEESRYSVSWSFDSLVSQSYAKRRLPSEQEWKSLWHDSIAQYQMIKEQADPISDKTVVVLAPSVVEQMNEQYLLPNFRGENILEGQSRFTQDEFQENKKLFAPGLCIEIDPTQPYEWASYRITSEGVPAVRTWLVQDGKVRSPYLNVKDANRWKCVPTAIPAGSMGIIMTHKDQKAWQKMLEDIDDGVLILSVLGLHTQNAVTGSFSLAAPSALRIRNGRLIGKVDVRISGNYWEILGSHDVVYGKEDIYKDPYILTPYYAQSM